jgi:rRNA maturation RNase YbeY
MISYNNIDSKYIIKGKRKISKWIQSSIMEEGKVLESVSFNLCTDSFIIKLNNKSLQHNYFTDIITFDLTPKNENEITAELYISTDRVKFNAKDYNTTISNELHRVIFHGILHLCGYKDKSKKDIALMRSKEQEYLSLYFPA